MMKALSLSSLILLSACHPMAMFRAPLIKHSSLVAISTAPSLEGKNISVAIDSYGIPFLKADSLEGAIYALGFMHARDRLFQLDLVRHAALGRVSELFGERTLDLDRKLRVISYKLSEQMNNLRQSEQRLLEIYVRGVNDSAKLRGRTAEHFLLGTNFEEFTKEHVLAISRLQSWQLSSDLVSEITRLKIAKSDLDLATKAEYFSPVDDRNTAIIAGPSKALDARYLIMPAYLKQPAVLNKSFSSFELMQIAGGASNAWAVHGSKTIDNHAILMNDPHLRHTWPSNFYLATLAFGDTQVSGATFVGLPAVLIGSSKWLSWGVTASFLNNQDAVYLVSDDKDHQAYWLEGQKMMLESWPQRFCLNKKGRCLEEEHFTSIFGPVIDSRHDPLIDQGDRLAIMWTGFLVDQHQEVIHPFVALAQAKSVSEGVKIVSSMSLPGVNMLLADTKGDIAYAYAGLVPRRDPGQNPFLPLDGSLKSSLWQGVLEAKDEPKIINPPAGYLITANQNIYGPKQLDADFGQQGAPPYRALQIKDRLEQLLKKSPISMAELGDLQQDSSSVEAKELAPYLGRICQQVFSSASQSRKKFADLIANFDANYTTESLSALPYETMISHIIEDRLQKALGESLNKQAGKLGPIGFAIKHALLKELSGQKTAMFAHSDLASLCEPAFLKLKNMAGEASWKWRWGRHHYLQRQSPLAAAPLIGGFFRDAKREVAGSASSPLAETGTPVMYGANLRLQARMSTPPELKLVLDSGNNGSIGNAHSFDQVKLWHEGQMVEIISDWELAKKNAELKFELTY